MKITKLFKRKDKNLSDEASQALLFKDHSYTFSRPVLSLIADFVYFNVFALSSLNLFFGLHKLQENQNFILQWGIPIYALFLIKLYLSAKSKIIISEQGIHFKYGLRNRRVNWNDINSVYSDSSLQQIIIETSLKKHVLVQRWWTNKQRLSFAQMISFFYSDLQIKVTDPITREYLKQEFSKDLGKNTRIFAWLSVLLFIIGGYINLIFDPYQTVEHGYFGVLILTLAGLSFAFAYSKIKTTPEMKSIKILICFIFSGGMMYFNYGILPLVYDLYAKPVSTPFTLISQSKDSGSEIWQDHSGLNFNCFMSTRSLQEQRAVEVIHAPLGMIRLQAKMVCIPRR